MFVEETVVVDAFEEVDVIEEVRVVVDVTVIVEFDSDVSEVVEVYPE